MRANPNTNRAVLVGMAAVGAILASLAGESTARACGGCFGPPGPGTQVTAHRMAFALSSRRTILWDQIQYVGDPSSFGWVLPIRNKVDVGVSSDDLFNRLESMTQPRVTPPPPPECHPEQVCRTRCSPPAPSGGLASDAGGSGAVFDTTSVDVWSTEVVGPYEATQLSATDGSALRGWLKDHDYQIPTEITPVIDQYVKEGFGFLAIKLVPKVGTQRMVPIRIAFAGAGTSLPLRMIAAGTGANVGIKLFVLGEGRWEAKNFPNADVKTEDLEWDFAAMGSNFGVLENAIVAGNPSTWITESTDSLSTSGIFAGLPLPPTTDAGAFFATNTDETEIANAFAGRTLLRVTRLFAQLPVSALANDLDLQASVGGVIPQTRQAPKSRNFVCPKTVEVTCVGVSPDCADPTGGRTTISGGFGCTTTALGEPPGDSSLTGLAAMAGVAAALALLGSARRRPRKYHDTR